MHFEGLSFSTGIIGEDSKTSKSIRDPKPTKWQLIQAVERSTGLDESSKARLIEKINSYPANTMHHFLKNIHKHIKSVQLDKARSEKDEIDKSAT